MSSFLRRNKKKGLLALLLLLRERAKQVLPLLALLFALSFFFLPPSDYVVWVLDSLGHRFGLRGELGASAASGGIGGFAGMFAANLPGRPLNEYGLVAPDLDAAGRSKRLSVGLVAGGRAMREEALRRRAAAAQAKPPPAPAALRAARAVLEDAGRGAENGPEGGIREHVHDGVGREAGTTIGGVIRPEEARKYRDGVALDEGELEGGLAHGILGVGKRLSGFVRTGNWAGGTVTSGTSANGTGADATARGSRSEATLLASAASRNVGGAAGGSRRTGGDADPALLRDAVAPWTAPPGGLPVGAADRMPRAAMAGGGSGAFAPRAAQPGGADMMRAAFGSTPLPSSSDRADVGSPGGRLSWQSDSSDIFQAQTFTTASDGSPKTVMYQLAEGRAYSVAAAPPPGHCAPGACPAEYASNTGGAVFDGGRLRGGVIVSEEFGDPGVGIPDQASIDSLMREAQKAEDDAMKCEQAEADYGPQERGYMEEIQRLSEQLNAMGCGSGGCSKSKYKRCMAVGNQMRAVCRGYNDVSAKKAAACPLMTQGYSAIDCSK